VKAESNALPAMSDWSWLERVVRKDESALSELYDRYSGLVFSEVKRIFYQIWQTASRFDPQRGSLPGWLVVVARNRAISKLRRKSGKADELPENAVDLRVDLATSSTQNLLLEKVRRVLSGLPDGQRAAIEFAYFEGMSHSEIAEKTGEPLGTIKTRIRSALETLERVLN
jgi:RNA polymerase sigma-70 factor (ECF subfamily)